MFDDIEKQLRIYLTIQRRPTRNAYAGKGTGRYARNDRSTRILADTVAASIGRVYHFNDGDRRLSPEEITDVIFAALKAVPDELAKRYADKLTLHSEPACAEIAARVHLALAERCAISFHPASRPLHSNLFSNGPR